MLQIPLPVIEHVDQVVIVDVTFDLYIFEKLVRIVKQNLTRVPIGLINIGPDPTYIILVALAQVTLQHVILVAKVQPVANVVRV